MPVNRTRINRQASNAIFSYYFNFRLYVFVESDCATSAAYDTILVDENELILGRGLE